MSTSHQNKLLLKENPSSRSIVANKKLKAYSKIIAKYRNEEEKKPQHRDKNIYKGFSSKIPNLGANLAFELDQFNS